MTAATTQERGIQSLPIAAISVSKWNPRKIDPKDPATVALAESMAGTAGLIQPIAVRLHPVQYSADPNHCPYELLAGSRRLAAAKLLKWETIAAEIFEVDDATALRIIVVENLQRQNLTPLEEAAGLRVLLDKGGDHATIAKDLGWPLSRVVRRAQLLKLIPEWQDLVNTRLANIGYTASHLELIARFPEEQQRAFAADARQYGYQWNVRTTAELDEFLQEFMHLLSRAPWKQDDDTLTKAGACTACPKRASVQPELFWVESDMPKSLQGEDRCLHAACWKAKQDAHLVRKMKEAKAVHPKLVLINSEDFLTGADAAPIEKLAEKEKLPLLKYKRDYTRVKKTESGAIPALVALGKGVGTLTWIKRKSTSGGSTAGTQAGESGEKRPGRPLAEREGQLARKRWNHVAAALQNRLEDEGAVNTVMADRTLAEMSELVHGVIGAAPAQLNRDVNDLQSADCEEFFMEYDRLARLPEQDVYRTLWQRECVSRVSEVIQFSTRWNTKEGPDTDERRMVERICAMTRLAVVADLEAEAAEAFKEPMSWAKERAALAKEAAETAPKKPKGERRKKKHEKDVNEINDHLDGVDRAAIKITDVPDLKKLLPGTVVKKLGMAGIVGVSDFIEYEDWEMLAHEVTELTDAEAKQVMEAIEPYRETAAVACGAALPKKPVATGKPEKKPAKKPTPPHDFMAKLTPSAELAAIVGDKPKPRTEVMKRLWKYIVDNGLQDKKNKRMINTDEKLAAVMGGLKQVLMFDMTKRISKHLR